MQKNVAFVRADGSFGCLYLATSVDLAFVIKKDLPKDAVKWTVIDGPLPADRAQREALFADALR